MSGDEDAPTPFDLTNEGNVLAPHLFEIIGYFDEEEIEKRLAILDLHLSRTYTTKSFINKGKMEGWGKPSSENRFLRTVYFFDYKIRSSDSDKLIKKLRADMESFCTTFAEKFNYGAEWDNEGLKLFFSTGEIIYDKGEFIRKRKFRKRKSDEDIVQYPDPMAPMRADIEEMVGKTLDARKKYGL